MHNVYFLGRHTGENIARAFDAVVKEFGLESKIKSVVTDNATNMIKSFSLPSMDITLSRISIDMASSDEEDEVSLAILTELVPSIYIFMQSICINEKIYIGVQICVVYKYICLICICMCMYMCAYMSSC